MAFTRITEEDIKNRGVTGLPDTPNLSTAEMQAKFDELSLDVIIPKLNNLIGELELLSASESIGITADDELTENKNIQAVFNALYERVKSLGQTGHSHENKEVLDEITDELLNSLNEIVSLLDPITEVSDTINGKSEALATCKAVADYVQELGGGDMTRAMYDTDKNGIVDDSERLGGNLPEYYQSAEDDLLETDAKNIVGAINEVNSKEVSVLDTYEEIMANTTANKAAGAVGVKQGFEAINDSLEKLSASDWQFVETVTGKTQVTIPDGAKEILVIVSRGDATYVKYDFILPVLVLTGESDIFIRSFSNLGSAHFGMIQTSPTSVEIYKVRKLANSTTETNLDNTSTLSLYYR